MNMINFTHLLTMLNRSLNSEVVKDIAIGAEDLGFDSRTGQIGHCCQQLATAATLLGNCVGQALTSVDGPRHS